MNQIRDFYSRDLKGRLVLSVKTQPARITASASFSLQLLRSTQYTNGFGKSPLVLIFIQLLSPDTIILGLHFSDSIRWRVPNRNINSHRLSNIISNKPTVLIVQYNLNIIRRKPNQFTCLGMAYTVSQFIRSESTRV
jgi:hypothetical protein